MCVYLWGGVCVYLWRGVCVCVYLWGGASVCGALVLLQQGAELVPQGAQSQARGQSQDHGLPLLERTETRGPGAIYVTHSQMRKLFFEIKLRRKKDMSSHHTWP